MKRVNRVVEKLREIGISYWNNITHDKDMWHGIVVLEKPTKNKKKKTEKLTKHRFL